MCPGVYCNFQAQAWTKNRTGSSKPVDSNLFVWSCPSVVIALWYLMNPCTVPWQLPHLICGAAILSSCVLCLTVLSPIFHCFYFITFPESSDLFSLPTLQCSPLLFLLSVFQLLYLLCLCPWQCWPFSSLPNYTACRGQWMFVCPLAEGRNVEEVVHEALVILSGSVKLCWQGNRRSSVLCKEDGDGNASLFVLWGQNSRKVKGKWS